MKVGTLLEVMLMVDTVKAWQDISLQLLHGFLMARRCGFVTAWA